MTGYAAVRTATTSGELEISLRSVNHRALDLHFYLAPAAAPVENDMRALLKDNIGRGHVEVRVHWTAETPRQAPAIDRSALAAYVAALRAAAADLGLDSHPDLNALLTLPGVVSIQSAAAAQPEVSQPLLNALARCVGEFNECRGREGAALAEHILVELSAIEQQNALAAGLRTRCARLLQDNIRARLSALLSETGIPESRIVEEAAIVADKSDIQEELTRLDVHCAELRRVVGQGGDVGKRIDFLLQEMNRETNTLLSKSSNLGDLGLELTNAGLQIKAAIEKIREQALNLE